MDWDAFISHASEDKDAIARPLCNLLQERGLKIWFDEFTLTIGDSLRRSIDSGLANSKFGVVIISPHFLQKEWPQRELDGLVAREIAGVKVILPVWHDVSVENVRAYSPILADRLAASSREGLERVANRLVEAIRKSSPQRVSTSKTDGSPARGSQVRVYCSRWGAEAGMRSTCIGSYTNHDFVTNSATATYCSRCGSMPGTRSSCIGAYTSHNFINSDAVLVHCSRCGTIPGLRSTCIGAYTNHNFIEKNSQTAYCSRCGATPGTRSNCIGAYTSHDFQ